MFGFNKRSVTLWTSVFAILGLAISTVSVTGGDLQWQSALIAASIASGTIAVFVNSFSLSEDIGNTAEGIKGELNKLKTLTEQRGDFYYRGSDNDAFGLLTSRFERAVRVRNTYLPLGSQLRRSLFDPDRVNLFKSFAERPETQFIEVIGRDAYLSLSEAQRQQLTYGEEDDAEIFVTNRVFPETNFVILEYENEKPEVWFGWGGLLSLETGHVFSTTDRNAVDYFGALFDTLRAVSGKPTEPQSVVGRLSRYQGFWIDLAFESPLGAPTKDNKPAIEKLANVAIVRFYVENAAPSSGRDSRLAVEGLAFKFDKDKRDFADCSDRYFRSTSCEMRKQRIYVSHEADNPLTPGDHEKSSGHSLYDFEVVDRLGIMTGRIFAPYVGRPGEEYRLDLKARKLNGDLHEAVSERWDMVAEGMMSIDEVKGLREEFHKLLDEVVGAEPSKNPEPVPEKTKSAG
ncbi:MAG: hypothetical protein AAF697_12390 [Pseudomonadota bacterium]